MSDNEDDDFDNMDDEPQLVSTFQQEQGYVSRRRIDKIVCNLPKAEMNSIVESVSEQMSRAPYNIRWEQDEIKQICDWLEGMVHPELIDVGAFLYSAHLYFHRRNTEITWSSESFTYTLRKSEVTETGCKLLKYYMWMEQNSIKTIKR